MHTVVVLLQRRRIRAKIKHTLATFCLLLLVLSASICNLGQGGVAFNWVVNSRQANLDKLYPSPLNLDIFEIAGGGGGE